MHPTMCTTLLRVFDCKNVDGMEGSSLRADSSIECLSREHKTYQVQNNDCHPHPPTKPVVLQRRHLVTVFAPAKDPFAV